MFIKFMGRQMFIEKMDDSCFFHGVTDFGEHVIRLGCFRIEYTPKNWALG
jgi:hypothetical protein